MRNHRHVYYRVPKAGKKLEMLITFVAVFEPLMTFPQIMVIWSSHKAQGVSIMTWSLYTVSAVVWLAYGLKIKSRPIVISSILWAITEAMVAVGAIIYRGA
jgi:uncharacterized protein with PQ loop repeat